MLCACWWAMLVGVLFACSGVCAAKDRNQPAADQQSPVSQPASGGASSQASPGSAAAGQALFMGTQRFANGGPACAYCHRTAGIPFPNGGTLGPDLSGAYDRFGPDALQVMLQTLSFPTMTPLFGKHPLTDREQGDLQAFFQQTSGQPAPSVTAKILVPAVIGFVVLLASAAGFWRKRLRYVRKSLVDLVEGRGKARS